MFGEKKKEVYLVYDKETEEYAEYMYNLISGNDDTEDKIIGVKDGTVSAIRWDEKTYNDNKNRMTSDNYVIIFGKNKMSKTKTDNLNIKFDKFGMTYGWLGKSAVMYVHSPIRRKETYEKFLEFASGYEKEFNKIEKLSDKISGAVNKMLKKPAVAGAAGAAGAAAIGVPVVGSLFSTVLGAAIAPIAIDSQIAKKKIMKQQYACLALVMYMEGLNEFLEG